MSDKKPQVAPKGSKPWLSERKVTESVVQPDLTKPRKPFTKALTINVGPRKYLVVGGIAPKTSDGYAPYVPPQVIAKCLKLDLRECLLADPREIGKITAAEAAGLKRFGVEDMLAALKA